MVLVGLHPTVLSDSQLLLSNQLSSLHFANEETEACNKIVPGKFFRKLIHVGLWVDLML